MSDEQNPAPEATEQTAEVPAPEVQTEAELAAIASAETTILPRESAIEEEAARTPHSKRTAG